MADNVKKAIAERGEADLEKQVVKMNEGNKLRKRRGRKPNANKIETEQATAPIVRVREKMAHRIEEMSKEEVIKAIEDEVGKKNLLKLAVRYIFISLGGEN